MEARLGVRAGNPASDEAGAEASGGPALREAGAGANPVESGEVPPEDEGAPIGPNETEEMAFLGERQATEPGPGLSVASLPDHGDNGETAGALPPLEELLQQISSETRELLDELFRAKFVGVRRVSQKDLKQ